jgi:hypothetical protein
MADFVFNIAKGRAVELADRVKNNDPSGAVLVVILLDSVNIETDAVLMDKDTFSDVVSGATNEAANGGYARKILTDADLAAIPAPDDTNNRNERDIPDQTFAAVAAGNGIAKVVVCYDPVAGSGTDADLIPLTCHDYAMTPDGSDLIVQIDPLGFLRAA